MTPCAPSIFATQTFASLLGSSWPAERSRYFGLFCWSEMASTFGVKLTRRQTLSRWRMRARSSERFALMMENLMASGPDSWTMMAPLRSILTLPAP